MKSVEWIYNMGIASNTEQISIKFNISTFNINTKYNESVSSFKFRSHSVMKKQTQNI
jgi:hypothetical protein